MYICCDGPIGEKQHRFCDTISRRLCPLVGDLCASNYRIGKVESTVVPEWNSRMGDVTPFEVIAYSVVSGSLCVMLLKMGAVFTVVGGDDLACPCDPLVMAILYDNASRSLYSGPPMWWDRTKEFDYAVDLFISFTYRMVAYHTR